MKNEWADFLNPDVVRARFVRAGLFLVAHEMLVSAIVGRLHDFYADHWDAETGWTASPAYREKVLSLDPKNKRDPWRASVAWLRQIDAITDDDERAIRELNGERNRLAHELRKVVGSSYHHDFEGLFPQLLALVEKIERWWVVNVEIATDPEFMDKEIDAASVMSGSQILLQILAEVALGQDDKAWAFYRDFMARQSSA